MRRKRDPMAGVIIRGGKQPQNPPPPPVALAKPPKPPTWVRPHIAPGDYAVPMRTDPELARARALISWIDGKCVDEAPHMEIRDAINRYREGSK